MTQKLSNEIIDASKADDRGLVESGRRYDGLGWPLERGLLLVASEQDGLVRSRQQREPRLQKLGQS
jgi:hypothetical protein